MVDGILNLPWWGYIVATLIVTHVTIVSVTVFLHRHQAHRALELHPVVSHFFRFWLWLTTGMVTKEWTAIHRKHHAKCETVDDPHSPQVLGISKVLWEGSELYRAEAKNNETLEKYGFGTPDDWLERHVYSGHSRTGVIVLFVINLILFGAGGISIWAMQMLWIPIWAAGVVNGIGHYWGYRNFETSDAATNISPWGILIGGEELHNNHHAFPSSARMSSRPWEFDIGWMYISILARLGLAEVKKVAPEPVIVPGKESVDLETVRAVLANRFHILSSYCKQVIHPVLREEAGRADKADSGWSRLLKRARRGLVRDAALIDENDRLSLSAVLKQSQALDTVYQHKLRLQAIWQRGHATQDLVAALQEWCRQAEATGIKCLSDFAAKMPHYCMQPSFAQGGVPPR